MSARDSRFNSGPAAVRGVCRAGRFVRLAQLRKLRECEQVAAICYRLRTSGLQFLLIRTRGSGCWTFPKGSAEPGLTHAQAAALEAFEEAGVHGRIEEVPFARYFHRKGGRSSGAKSTGQGLRVDAHLCEVSRLSTPKEPNRNRTWFLVEEAKAKLQEGRKPRDGAEFGRVVDRAVARIQQLREGMNLAGAARPLRQEVWVRDPLQRVQFEAARELRDQRVSELVRMRRSVRQSSVSGSLNPRAVLPGEILQFSAPPEKKIKALGTGARNA